MHLRIPVEQGQQITPGARRLTLNDAERGDASISRRPQPELDAPARIDTIAAQCISAIVELRKHPAPSVVPVRQADGDRS